MNFIIALFRWLFRTRVIVPDEVKAPPSVPTTTSAQPAPTSSALSDLLALIRSKESGKAAYNSDYRNDDHFDLVHMTFDQARAAGRSQVLQGEASSAIGAYQFLTKTLDMLKSQCKLMGTERFGVELQDKLAVQLMRNRGYDDYMRRTITAEQFCNRLAMEWASLPVVTPIKGAHRALRVGQSYYAGDGINSAGHKPEVVLKLVKAL